MFNFISHDFLPQTVEDWHHLNITQQYKHDESALTSHQVHPASSVFIFYLVDFCLSGRSCGWDWGTERVLTESEKTGLRKYCFLNNIFIKLFTFTSKRCLHSMVHENKKQNKQVDKTNISKHKNTRTPAQIHINNTWIYSNNVQYEQSRKSLQHDVGDIRLHIVQIGLPHFTELVCFWM